MTTVIVVLLLMIPFIYLIGGIVVSGLVMHFMKTEPEIFLKPHGLTSLSSVGRCKKALRFGFSWPYLAVRGMRGGGSRK